MFAEFAIDLEFFCGELCEHLLVAAAVGFGDEGAEFALAAFEVAVLEGVEGVFDLLGQGLSVGGALGSSACSRARARRTWLCWSGAASSGLGGAGALERVSRSAAEGRLSYHSGWSESWSAARVRAGSCSGRTRARRRTRSVSLAGSWVVGADAFDALGGGLFELLAEDGGVDAEFLRGVGGELVALDAVGHAADVGEEEVEGLDLGVGGAAGEAVAGAVDEVVGVALGVAEGGHVGLDALLADEAVGVEAAFEGDDL